MSLRIGGLAAVVGGIRWAVALAGGSMTQDGAVWLILILIATFALLVAMTGLSAFQARRFPRLIWAAFGVPAIGAMVSVPGLAAMLVLGDRPFIGDVSPWYVWAFGTLTMMVGSALFAVATWRANSLSRPAAAALAIGAVAILPALSGTFGFVSETMAGVLVILTMLAFAGGWSGLGISALRIDRTAQRFGASS